MKPAFSINVNLEIKKNGQLFLNERRVALLKLVGEMGSINAASKELKMSYQQAWHFIQEMNEISPLPLVVRKRGGSNGGGAQITKTGIRTITEFEQLIEAHNLFQQSVKNNMWECFFEKRYTLNE